MNASSVSCLLVVSCEFCLQQFTNVALIPLAYVFVYRRVYRIIWEYWHCVQVQRNFLAADLHFVETFVLICPRSMASYFYSYYMDGN